MRAFAVATRWAMRNGMPMEIADRTKEDSDKLQCIAELVDKRGLTFILKKNNR